MRCWRRDGGTEEGELSRLNAEKCYSGPALVVVQASKARRGGSRSRSAGVAGRRAQSGSVGRRPRPELNPSPVPRTTATVEALPQLSTPPPRTLHSHSVSVSVTVRPLPATDSLSCLHGETLALLRVRSCRELARLSHLSSWPPLSPPPLQPTAGVSLASRPRSARPFQRMKRWSAVGAARWVVLAVRPEGRSATAARSLCDDSPCQHQALLRVHTRPRLQRTSQIRQKDGGSTQAVTVPVRRGGALHAFADVAPHPFG